MAWQNVCWCFFLFWGEKSKRTKNTERKSVRLSILILSEKSKQIFVIKSVREEKEVEGNGQRVMKLWRIRRFVMIKLENVYGKVFMVKTQKRINEFGWNQSCRRLRRIILCWDELWKFVKFWRVLLTIFKNWVKFWKRLKKLNLRDLKWMPKTAKNWT